jgi:hypothetical protein
MQSKNSFKLSAKLSVSYSFKCIFFHISTEGYLLTSKVANVGKRSALNFVAIVILFYKKPSRIPVAVAAG